MTTLPTLVRRLRPSSHRADRGASLVEYALLVAFFAVTILGAVETLQDDAGDRLESQSEVAGSPTEVNGYFGIRGGTPTGGSPGATTPDTTPVTLSSIALSGGGAKHQGSWTATVTVTATDPSGNPIPDVEIAIQWSGAGAKDGSTIALTGPDGTHTFLVDGISNGNKQVTFTVTSAIKEGHVFGALPQAVIERD